jgi:hypothetical protein
MCHWGNQDREALALEIEQLYLIPAYKDGHLELSTIVERIIEFIKAFER